MRPRRQWALLSSRLGLAEAATGCAVALAGPLLLIFKIGDKFALIVVAVNWLEFRLPI